MIATDSTPLTLLVSSAGRRVELLSILRQTCGSLGVPVNLIATDAHPEMSAACRLADAAHRVPLVTDESFVDAMLEIVARERVAMVLPTIDPELAKFAQSEDQFRQAGARVVISSVDAIATCRNKLTTMARLSEHGIRVPTTAAYEARHELMVPDAPRNWIVKPVAGSASRNLSLCSDLRSLPPVVPEEMLVQEFVDGPEFTTNVFVDARGAVRCSVPHERLRTRGGEVEKGRTTRMPALADAANAIVAAVPGLRGPICFQSIVDPSRGPIVIEINARLGGGYPLAHAAGATFVQWLIEEHLGRVPAYADDWIDGLTMLRYDQSLFIQPPDGAS